MMDSIQEHITRNLIRNGNSEVRQLVVWIHIVVRPSRRHMDLFGIQGGKKASADALLLLLFAELTCSYSAYNISQNLRIGWYRLPYKIVAHPAYHED